MKAFRPGGFGEDGGEETSPHKVAGLLQDPERLAKIEAYARKVQKGDCIFEKAKIDSAPSYLQQERDRARRFREKMKKLGRS